MPYFKSNKTSIIGLFTLIIVGLLFSSCNKNPAESSGVTDEQFIQNVLVNGYSQTQSDEDNLSSQEFNDLNDGGVLGDNDGGFDTPIDSLYKWGRIVSDVNVNVNITNEGDSVRNGLVTRTITGKYVIQGYVGGILQTINKPYTEVLKRNFAFKRINSTNDASRNWRLYKIGVLDGESTQPQQGSSKVRIDKVEIYTNGSSNPTYSFNGPDFQNIMFVTRHFGGSGIPVFSRGSQLYVKVYTTSQNSTIDYVAWHWAKNSFGFHRVPFQLISQTGSGPYSRVYAKTFSVFNN